MQKKIDWNLVAIFISGACIGWLESVKTTEEINAILLIAVSIITGTVVLGASVKFTNTSTKYWIERFLEAEKSAWPMALFLVGFTIAPPIICMIVDCPAPIPCKPCP